MISELMLVSPREGKVQFQPAHAGDSVAAGAPIVTLIDLADVYMTVFLRAADAGKLAFGDEARLILDAAPDYVVPAAVSFVASVSQVAPKAVEAKDNLAKLMLRVDLKIDPKVVETYYGKVGTGLRGAVIGAFDFAISGAVPQDAPRSGMRDGSFTHSESKGPRLIIVEVTSSHTAAIIPT